jgi:hypothetical protein
VAAGTRDDSKEHVGPPKDAGWARGGPAPKTPRERLVAVLTETIAAALPAGDLHAARVAHEALGRLLAERDPGASSVTDLASERAKRERKE